MMMPDGEHQYANITLAGVRCPRVSSKPGEPTEQWGEEVCLHVVNTLPFIYRPSFPAGEVLHRVAAAPAPCSGAASVSAGAGRITLPGIGERFCPSVLEHLHWDGYASFRTLRLPILMPSRAVLHPAGNVAEHLVANGLARVVDWHAGMLASGGSMERLRAAERAAKEKRVALYANVPAATTSSKSNGSAANGASRAFDATVVRVWSGDQISVVPKEGGKERRVQLSSTRAPK